MKDETKRLLKDVEEAVAYGDMTIETALEEAMNIGFKEASDRAYAFFSEKAEDEKAFSLEFMKAMIKGD